MRLALASLALALALPAVSAAQVRTSDAPVALALSAGTAYIVDVGRAGLAVSAEVASRHLGVSAAVSLPADDVERAFGLSAMVYPGGRTAPAALALGAEGAIVGGDGGPYTLAGPVGAFSYRLVNTPDFLVVPEVRVGLLLPFGENASRSNLAAQSAASAGITLGGKLSPGVVTTVTPSVSRSVPLGSTFDQSVVAVGVDAAFVISL
ncbi:MAG TPA: hypothetical protein VF594_03930 [Rubricoccaceae bacterium]|jgi:hypothetical protein